MHALYKILKTTPPKRGPHSTVWLAQDLVLNRDVALKEFRGWASRPVRACAAFEFAHRRRLTLDHPGLAPVHGAENERGWLVLDYHAPGSLAGDGSPSEGMPADTVRRVLVDVLETLSYLHEKRLLHGAVKPSNFFVAADGHILLADGLGLPLNDDGRAAVPRGVFQIFDSVEAKYLAPECLDGKDDRIGPAADLYSVGLAALELLLGDEWFTGLFPRVRAAVQRWDEWHLSEERLPPVQQIHADIPADLANLIDGLIQKTPERRPTIAEAKKQLGSAPTPSRIVEPAPSPIANCEEPLPAISAAASIESQSVGPPPSDAPVSWRRRRRWLTTLAAGVLGLAVGAVVAHQLPHANETPSVAPIAPREAIHLEGASRAEKLERDLQASRVEIKRLRDEVDSSAKSVVQLVSNVKNAPTIDDVARERDRADQLAVDLKSAQADLAQAAKNAEKHKIAAAKLIADLDETRADLDRARKDLGDLRSRPADSATIPPLLALKYLGATMDVDTSRPDRPVIRIDLTASRVTNEDLSLLEGFTELRKLSLSSTVVGDAGLPLLKKMTKLQSLHLSTTKVTDAGLVHLKDLPALQVLDLAYTQVSDAGLAQLKSPSALKSLDVVATRVTSQGIVDFRQRFPSCQVQHESLWPSTTLPK